MKRLFLLLAAGLILSACSSAPYPRFIYPPPPEEPRIEFIGTYDNQDDFPKTWFEALMTRFVGGMAGDFFISPFGIASNGEGLVYISDIHAKNVKIFDFNRREVYFLVKEPVFDTPLGLAVDRRGRLYVCDGGKGGIFVFEPGNSVATRLIRHAAMVKAAYAAINETLGRIYVSDPVQHRIVVFDLEGNYLFHFGEPGGAPGKLFSPQGLAIGPDGRVVVPELHNARISVFDSEGKFLRSFGERGDQVWQFENPKSCAFDSEGHLYVTDARKGTVTVYDTDSTLLLVLGEGRPSAAALGFSMATQISIDKNDRFYAADIMAKRFAVWQYFSAAYKAKNPISAEELQQVKEYVDKHGKKGTP